MGFDDIEDGRFAAPSLTTIAPDREQIAERAVQCLTERVLGRFEALPGRRIVVPHRVLPRESTGGPVPRAHRTDPTHRTDRAAAERHTAGAAASSSAAEPVMIVRTCRVMCSRGQSHQAVRSSRSMSSSP